MTSNQPLKLLVVDDEETILDYTQKWFQKKGFTTFGTTDGVTAVEIYAKEKPEISLIDVHMPFSPIDGVETLQKIKEINPDAVCLMVSRITDKKRVQACKDAGALAYLHKPLSLHVLDAAVEKAKAYVKG